jgi:uncharacterized damage-inducible protein DinB
MSGTAGTTTRPEGSAMQPEHVRLLYDYDAWANRRMLDACGQLSSEQFTRDLHSSFPSVRDTIAHILGGCWFWLERWRGRAPASVPKPDQHPDLASLRGFAEQIEGEVQWFVAGFSAPDLARVFQYRTTEGKENSQPFWQMLQHVANHGSYHRGQVTTMLRQLGGTAVATDLIAFYRERGQAALAPSLAPESVCLLYEYNAWANRRMLEACAALSDEQFTRNLGSSFPSARDTVAHILWAEWLWLERWQGRSPGPPASESLDLAGLRARWEDVESARDKFIAGLASDDLARMYEFRTTKGVIYPSALWQAMQHVANHGTYHRGQVATMLRQLGAKANFTDLIYFYRQRAGQALD